MHHRGSHQAHRGEGGGDNGRQRDRQRTPTEGVGGNAAESPAPGENFSRSEKRSEQTDQHEAEATLAYNRVGVLHHGVHGVGEVVLQWPGETEGLKVQPQFADGGVGGTNLEVAGALGSCVETEVGDVLAGLSPTAQTKDTAGAKAVSTAASHLSAQSLALGGGVAGTIGAQAGLALSVGELHHREHVQQPGAHCGGGGS